MSSSYKLNLYKAVKTCFAFVVFTQAVHALSTSNLNKLCVHSIEHYSLMVAEVRGAFRQQPRYQTSLCDANVAAGERGLMRWI